MRYCRSNKDFCLNADFQDRCDVFSSPFIFPASFCLICLWRFNIVTGPERTYRIPQRNSAIEGWEAMKININMAITSELKFIFLNNSGFLKLLYLMELTIKKERL